jgi:hypothetical protein
MFKEATYATKLNYDRLQGSKLFPPSLYVLPKNYILILFQGILIPLEGLEIF